MSKGDKYLVLSPFSSNGKVFTFDSGIIEGKDISEHDLESRIKGGYIKKVNVVESGDSFLEVVNSVVSELADNINDKWVKKKKRR